MQSRARVPRSRYFLIRKMKPDRNLFLYMLMADWQANKKPIRISLLKLRFSKRWKKIKREEMINKEIRFWEEEIQLSNKTISLREALITDMTETEERESIKNNTKKKEKVSTKNNIRKKDKTMNKDQVRIYIKKRSIIIQKKLSKSLFPPFNLF